MRAWLASVALLQGSLVAPASAQQRSDSAASHVRVLWVPEVTTRHQACVDERRTRDAVTRSLGRDVFGSARESDVRLVVRSEPGSRAVELILEDGSGASLGSRRLRAESCRELTELVSFTLSVMLDFRVAEISARRALAERDAAMSAAGSAQDESSPQASGSDPAVGDAAASAPGSPQAAEAALQHSPTAPRASERDTLLRILVGATGGIGAAPTWLAGAFLGANWGVGAGWGARVLVSHARGPAIIRRGGQLRAARYDVEAAVCRDTLHAAWRIGACLGAIPGISSITATGYPQDIGATAWSLTLTPSLQVAAQLSGAWSLLAGVGVDVPLVAYDWIASRGTQQVVLYEAPPLGLRGWLGFGFD